MTFTYATDKDITPIAADVLRAARERVYGDTEINLVEAPTGRKVDIAFGPKSPGRVVFPTVAQLMNSATALSDAVAGFRVLRAVSGEPVPPHVVDPDDRTLGYDLVVDIEVAGDVRTDLPWETPLLSVAVYDGEHLYVLTPEWIEEHGLAWLGRHNLITWNGRFDIRTLNHQLGLDLKVGDDGLLMYYAMNHGAKTKGLKPLAQKLLGAEEWEVGLKKYTVGGAHYENIPKDLLYSYNAADVVHTWRLWSLLSSQLDDNSTAVYRRLLDISELLGDVEDNGIGVDVDYFHDLSMSLGEKADRLREQLGGVNPNSPKQVKEYFASLGHEISGTSEEILKDLQAVLAEDDPARKFVDDLLEYRGTVKMRSTYAEGMLTRTRGNIVYPSYSAHGTTTGRLSSSGPNIQNLPRGPLIRTGIVPSTPGNILVENDYSQAELRTIAELSNDPKMIAAFQPGQPDFFDTLMPSIYPSMFGSVDDFRAYKEADGIHAKDLRAAVKGVVYGLNYGRGARAIAKAIGLPVEDVDEIIRNYFEAYPDLARWRDEIAQAITDPAYSHLLTTPFGRTFQSEVVTGRNWNSVRNAALAFPVQSTANDICLDAAMQVNRQAEEFGARIRALVHDAILLECPPETAGDLARMVSYEMTESAARVFTRVPFETDAMEGLTWQELDE